MVTRRLRKDDQEFLKRLGKRIEKVVLKEKGYSSLDAFALEYHDLIAKPTLYQICEGQRDMKLTTLLRLAEALNMGIVDLMKI